MAAKDEAASVRIESLAEFQLLRGGALLLFHLEESLGPLETWWPERRVKTLEEAGVPMRRAKKLASRRFLTRVRAGLARLPGLGFHAWECARDPVWFGLPEPPLLLFRRGTLPSGPRLSVVGARHPSAYALRVVHKLSRELAGQGVPIVSGLARGIDGAAHRGALEAEGATVAVLGSGPDCPYPPEHDELLLRVGETGCVLSEHLPGEAPRPFHFPRRNRLLVALGKALLLGEARLKSGSLTSVRWAADLGREVLVLPGPVESPLFEAPLQLLREGATPVGRSEHLLEALGLEADSGNGRPVDEDPARFTPAEQRLLALLEGEAEDLDSLVRQSGEAPTRALTLLLGLEARGVITRDEGMAYRRVRP